MTEQPESWFDYTELAEAVAELREAVAEMLAEGLRLLADVLTDWADTIDPPPTNNARSNRP